MTGQQPYPPPGGQPPYGYGGPGGGSSPWQQPPEMVGPAPGVRFAGHGARLGAYILDAIIVGALFTILFLVIVIPLVATTRFSTDVFRDVAYSNDVMPKGLGATIDLVGRLFVALIIPGLVSLLYFPFFWARGGQTPGMKAAGIRVVRDRDGGRVGWGAAFVRLFGYWVSGAVFYLGFIWILIDSRRRGWHDLLAGTVVISDR